MPYSYAILIDLAADEKDGWKYEYHKDTLEVETKTTTAVSHGWSSHHEIFTPLHSSFLIAFTRL